MVRRFLYLLVVVILAYGCGVLPAPAAGRVDTDGQFPRIQFEKYRLKNGLEVILSENHSLPLVSVNIWYHVGPANERPGRTGFAHLFEHMMFEGSEHVGPKAHFKYLEAAGATGVNATTDFDETKYFETVPSNQIETALWLESDRMTDSDVSPEELAHAKTFWTQSLVGHFQTISSVVGMLSDEFVYGLRLDYYRTLPAEIDRVTASNVRNAAVKYLDPDGLVVVAVGDRARIEPDMVKLGLGPVRIVE